MVVNMFGLNGLSSGERNVRYLHKHEDTLVGYRIRFYAKISTLIALDNIKNRIPVVWVMVQVLCFDPHNLNTKCVLLNDSLILKKKPNNIQNIGKMFQ